MENRTLMVYHLYRLGTAGVDEAESFVVIAHDENTARRLASKQHGDEGSEFWFDLNKTEVDRIGIAIDQLGRQRVVSRSFNNG